ncbi:hypothetical protein D3C71_1339620 [compost metagenome]
MLGRQVAPELGGFHHRRLVQVDLVAGLVHQDGAVGRGQRLEQPVGERAARRNFDAPLRGVARGVLLGQFLAVLNQFGPGGRRAFGIQPGGLEQVLVVVHDDGRTLERHAPGVAARAAVLHEGVIEAAQPLLVGIGLGQRIDRHDGVFVDQGEHVGRQQHGQLRRRAALERRQRLGDGILVRAGVDGLDLDVGVFLLEVRHHVVDDLGDGAAHGHRVIELDFNGFVLRLCRQGQAGGGQAGGQGLQYDASHVVFPFLCNGRFYRRAVPR